jgi:hypothetical protein
VSWQQLADQSTTSDESRAIRNQLRQTSSDLRYHLEMRSQRVFLCRRAVGEDIGVEQRNLGRAG